MDYVNFGSAGFKVSRLALGLGLREQGDERDAQRVIETAIDAGINLIDCANIYSPLDDQTRVGRAERILGKAIRGKRDDIVITSKVGSPVGPGPNDRGLSRIHILREAERSLERLQTDYIDVYLVHIFDQAAPLAETIRALDDLVQSGKVRYTGCCNFQAWQVCRALWLADSLQATPFMCVQNPYNLLDRRLEREMFGLVRDQGLGVMAYSPLAVGLLGGTYRPDRPPPAHSLWARRPDWGYAERMRGPTGQVVSTLFQIAHELGRTPAQIATAWILARREVTVAIAGSNTIAELEDSRDAVDLRLDDHVLERLNAVSASFA